MKDLYTARLKALVEEAGISTVDLAAITEISRRRVADALAPATKAINIHLDTLVRLSVALSVLLGREPEDVFYDIVGENLTQLDALWEQSKGEEKPSAQVVLRKLGET